MTAEPGREATVSVVCHFSRIGRHHDVPPLSVPTDHADGIAALVQTYALPYLLSREVEVIVFDDGTGEIWGISRPLGAFTIERIVTDA